MPAGLLPKHSQGAFPPRNRNRITKTIPIIKPTASYWHTHTSEAVATQYLKQRIYTSALFSATTKTELYLSNNPQRTYQSALSTTTNTGHTDQLSQQQPTQDIPISSLNNNQHRTHSSPFSQRSSLLWAEQNTGLYSWRRSWQLKTAVSDERAGSAPIFNGARPISCLEKSRKPSWNSHTKYTNHNRNWGT
jgi:hypothetical protein